MLSSFFNIEPKESESSSSVSRNESNTLEELIAPWNGQDHNVPVSVFSAEDLIKATNNFDLHHIVIEDAFYCMYRGSFGKRPILIKKYGKDGSFWPLDDIKSFATRDTAMTLMMCSHSNVLKFIGCCHDFQFPALVYEHEGSTELLSHLYERDRGVASNGSLSWKSRLSVAIDIANVIVQLHTACSTPIIHRDLKPSNFIIDQGGVVKLLDFSLCIPIPPGESQVQDMVLGTYGFSEPQYVATGILTVKTDVYAFGMILLGLLTGKRPVEANRGGNHSRLDNCVKDYVEKNELNKVVDGRILEGGGGGIEEEQQFRAFAVIALRCTREKREDRPEMMEVAEELGRIQGSVDTQLA